MVFRRRRKRWPRRGRWRGRRRRYYWRRRGYHWYHRRRRGHFRHRHAAVTYTPSHRHKTLVVRGWEPLGNVCVDTIAKTEATPYLDLDAPMTINESTGLKSAPTNAKWSGSWGHHWFTLRTLLQRSQFYFNTFSSDWQGWDYVAFRGGYIWLPRNTVTSWMFYYDKTIQTNTTEMTNKYKNDKTWFHPAIWLNRPGTVLIPSLHLQRTARLWKRVRIRPPPIWEGQYRMDQALDFILTHWGWTVTDLEHAFYDIWCESIDTLKRTTNICNQEPWFIPPDSGGGVKEKAAHLNFKKKNPTADPRSIWVDRSHYLKSDCANQGTVQPNNANWGPFLPQGVAFSAGREVSFFFRYKFYFKLSGDSVYRRLPAGPAETTVPPAPLNSEFTGGEVPSRSILKKRKKPLSIYDILPGDLDEGGILTDRALARITGSLHSGDDVRTPHKPPNKRVKFYISPRQRRKRILRVISKLRGAMGGRDQPGGGGPPPSPPRRREPLDLLLNFPK
nr:ORF1 [Torque teno Leptonychotes weddellii virus 3]